MIKEKGDKETNRDPQNTTQNKIQIELNEPTLGGNPYDALEVSTLQGRNYRSHF